MSIRHRPFLPLIAFFAAGFYLNLQAAPKNPAKSFSGPAALADTRRATAFGERPSGSEAIIRLRGWIISQLKPLGGQLSLDSFQGQTPKGPVPMNNIILKFPGTTGKAVVLTGHYDTKRIAMVHFVGANDGGSSTGALLELARALSNTKHPDDLYFVFFDGEEAIAEWSNSDSRYGSQHLASKWGADGTLSHIKALINVDMVGDRDLDVLNDGNSSEALRRMVSEAAAKLGYSKYFHTEPAGIDDDHMPFVNEGVNAIDIIDFSYGPNNGYWHTGQDTMDKLSAHSLQVVGDVVLAVVEALENSKSVHD